MSKKAKNLSIVFTLFFLCGQSSNNSTRGYLRLVYKNRIPRCFEARLIIQFHCMKKEKLPKSFKSYFWDVDFDSLTLENAPLLILKRVIDRGDTNAIRWMKRHYTDKKIIELLFTTRDLSQKSANFWADILGVDRKKVRCLQKPYSPIQWGLSS